MQRKCSFSSSNEHDWSGAFKSDLARRVAIPSESQNSDVCAELQRYVCDEMMPALEALGF